MGIMNAKLFAFLLREDRHRRSYPTSNLKWLYAVASLRLAGSSAK